MAMREKSDMQAPGKAADARILGAARGYFLAAGLFSLAINLLYLAGPLYMLQVYDRVISSGSVPTLVMLSLALLIAYGALAALDVVRGRILARAGLRLDAMLANRVVAATLAQGVGGAARSQPLRDLDTVRQFVTGQGINALFDLPWAPIYIAVIFMLHPALGAFALASVVVLIAMALLNEWLVRGASAEASEAASRNYSFTEMSLRNGEVIRAMGMTGGLLDRWSRDRNRMLRLQLSGSDRGGAMSSVIKFLRLSMQSLVLGLGAWLALQRLATVGAMFAASILLGRALQPVEQVVAGWRSLVAARSAYARVKRLLEAAPVSAGQLVLPRPDGALSVENLTLMMNGSQKAILRSVAFELTPGESLGIIGPSGAGKSTLARLLVGVVRPTMGAVRLDGADVSIWAREQLGRHVGYLPQDIELFSDTVAANIGRFQAGADEEIVRAAQLAGVHEMILRLPNGYDTEVGEGGAILSGGFRQRIALARAVFGNPSLVVLDEPSSNLDGEGDEAFARCVMQLKRQGATVVIISHRPATLSMVDNLMLLRDGVVEMCGPRDEMMQKLIRAAEPAQGRTPATRPAADAGGALVNQAMAAGY
jgi:ATP-binding cassette, subfamily C, bacterial